MDISSSGVTVLIKPRSRQLGSGAHVGRALKDPRDYRSEGVTPVRAKLSIAPATADVSASTKERREPWAR
jgi:hypothetical protein